MLINNISFINKSIAFKSYLDNQKSDLQKKLGSINRQIDEYKSSKAQEISNLNRTKSALDTQIVSAYISVDLTKNKISTLREKINKKNGLINEEKTKAQNYISQINQGNKKIEILEEEKQRKHITNQGNLKNIEKASVEKYTTESKKLSSIYSHNLYLAENGLKTQIIEKIINPTISLQEGEDVKLPSSALFENKTEDFNVEKNILEWIAKTSNSNYAYIDAEEIEDKNQLVLLLKKLSFLTKQEYGKNGLHSYIMISNFDKITREILTNENAVLLQKMLSESANCFNNTILVTTKSAISDARIKDKIKENFVINKSFLANKYFGEASLNSGLNALKYTGCNLLTKIRVL